ncbi:MAG: DUF4373 domain-containing protein [Ruminococcus sp.]|nr:DUF4373 domain-containing protein [Ruminococcus sp.]
MAKTRLDWFKLDCQMDSKVEALEAEFGLYGFAIVVKLYQRIYGVEGYYCEWNDDVALVFARKNGVGANVVSEIVQRAIARGVFDKGQFDKNGILTSHGIQERYYDAVDRRKYAKIKPEYLLLCTTQNSENADISSKNVNISEENADIFYTEKNRAEKNRIEQNRKDRKQRSANLDQVNLTDDERSELERLADRLTVDEYIKSIIKWQQEHHKLNTKPYSCIKKWIEQDGVKPGNDNTTIKEYEDFAGGIDFDKVKL